MLPDILMQAKTVANDPDKKSALTKQRMNSYIEQAFAKRVDLAKRREAKCLLCLDTGIDCGRFCSCEAGAERAFGIDSTGLMRRDAREIDISTLFRRLMRYLRQGF